MAAADKKSEKVYRWLLDYIDENKFTDSLRIPSENALCHRLEVSRDTVRTAMARLMEEGVILRVKGSGSYINKEAALSRELDSGIAPRKIGLILQGQDPAANTQMIRGVKSILLPEHFDLRVFLTANKFANERRCLQTVMDQDFQGFIVDGVKASLLNTNLDCYEQLCRRRVPVIFYNNYYRDLPYPRIHVDDQLCADRLMGLLIDAGHRHIASIFVYDHYQSVEKFHGMVMAMRKRGVEFQDDYVKWGISGDAYDPRYTREIVRFLKGLPACTAVVCCNYLIYRLVKQALSDMGRRVPEDCSLVCFDYSAEDWEQDGVTGSIQRSAEIGRQLGRRLTQMIRSQDGDWEKYSLVLPPMIHVGRSIKQIE